MKLIKVVTAIVVALAASYAQAAIPDAPLPVVDTGIPALKQVPGRFVWLDDDTLAVTTYGNEKISVDWASRKIVAYSVKRNATETLISKGFLTCSNPSHQMVSLELGDLQSMYIGNSKEPNPVRKLHRWDSSARKLVDDDVRLSQAWHPYFCVQMPVSEFNEAMQSWVSYRYLQPGDGRLEWDATEQSKASPVLWHKNGKLTALKLTRGQMARQISYLPFAKSYALAIGSFTKGLVNDVNDPVTLMNEHGEITRTPVPEVLIKHLHSLDELAHGQMFKVKNAHLVYVPSKVNAGGGFYLTGERDIKRVWCVSEQSKSSWIDMCRIEQLELSPDGCKVAFESPSLLSNVSGNSIKVLKICEGGDSKLQQLTETIRSMLGQKN